MMCLCLQVAGLEPGDGVLVLCTSSQPQVGAPTFQALGLGLLPLLPA